MGALIATMILSGRTLQPLGQLSGLLGRLNGAITAYKVVSQFMNETSQDEKTTHFFSRSQIFGQVNFKEVEFSYPNSEQKVLNNVSLNFAPGEKVAILGKVGCGKTTLLKLILGLHHCTSGSVLIDGANVQQLRSDDIRKNIGVVLQNPYLFSGTLRENIAFGLDVVSDEEILEAAKISCCLDFINKLENGFDYYLSENGRELSGGQRQGLTLARAIVRKPKILLLDEPTSSMDQSTEKLVIDNLNTYFSDQTVILVTHRMSLLKMVDRVIALDDGKVTVDGKKDDIVAKLKGIT
jgi:ATP-binding cassette subfamily C protein LapB